MCFVCIVHYGCLTSTKHTRGCWTPWTAVTDGQWVLGTELRPSKRNYQCSEVLSPLSSPCMLRGLETTEKELSHSHNPRYRRALYPLKAHTQRPPSGYY